MDLPDPALQEALLKRVQEVGALTLMFFFVRKAGLGKP